MWICRGQSITSAFLVETRITFFNPERSNSKKKKKEKKKKKKSLTKKHCRIQENRDGGQHKQTENVIHWFTANHFTHVQVYIKHILLSTIRWGNLHVNICVLSSILRVIFRTLREVRLYFSSFIARLASTFGLQATFPLWPRQYIEPYCC